MPARNTEPASSSSEIAECGYWARDRPPGPFGAFTIRRIEDAVGGVPAGRSSLVEGSACVRLE